MLPTHNIPSANKKGTKQLHPTDATQNFGLFLGGPQEPTHLKVVDCGDLRGFNDKKVGLGVFTEVFFMLAAK